MKDAGQGLHIVSSAISLHWMIQKRVSFALHFIITSKLYTPVRCRDCIIIVYYRLYLAEAAC